MRGAPWAVGASALAERLQISKRHLHRMDSAGMLPTPIRLGRSVRWPVEEINAWLKAGAPDRRRWEQVKDRSGGRN